MGMNPRLLRPTPTGFDPRRIAGLELWLDAADISSLGNTSTGPGGAANNGPIKYVADKSGNGRHATNSGADSVCPTLVTNALNSRSAISFDGGDSLLGSWPVTLTAQTTIVVGLMNGNGTGFARVFTQSDSSADFQTTGHYIPILDRTGSASQAPFASFATGALRAAVTASAATAMVMVSRHTGAQIQNSTNGGAAQTFSHTLNKTFTRYLLGVDTADTISGRLNGRIYEVAVYSRSLSDAELTTVIRYAGKKWGIAVA
jgi:hypothetical protein